MSDSASTADARTVDRPVAEHPTAPDERADAEGVELVDVRALAPEGYTDSCLRPLGLCELGGCCDSCWYGPNNPHSPLRRR